MATVLGFAYGHNSSACVVKDGVIAVAIQEERLTGRKRHRLRPGDTACCVDTCLKALGMDESDLDAVALVGADELGAPIAARFSGLPSVPVGHHMAHAAGAFLTSGCARASVLVIDAAGDPIDADGWCEAVSAYRASDHGLDLLWRISGRAFEQPIPDEGLPRFRSVGGMYSSVAYAIFGSIGDAGKVMGLAALGTPRWAPSCFLTWNGDTFEFHDELGIEVAGWRRWPDNAERWADLAASAQQALEHALADLLARLRADAPEDVLCLSGGVALNGVANEGPVATAGWPVVWIPPWAEDSGLAPGAALLVERRFARARAIPPRLVRDSVGPVHPRPLTEAAIDQGRSFADLEAGLESAPAAGVELAAERLAAGAVVGWFQGGSELGPRALGHRSILADARSAATKLRLNAEVKHRESYRPFAPVVTLAAAPRWFVIEPGDLAPFMLRVVPVRPEVADRIPAVVHHDGTARIQTVRGEDEPQLSALLAAFDALTSVPVLVNTSFNVMGEPIVESPLDALWSFATTGIDALWLDGALLVKHTGGDPLSTLWLQHCASWQDCGSVKTPRWLRFLGEPPWMELVSNASTGAHAIVASGSARAMQLSESPISARALVNQLGGGHASITAISLLRRLGALELVQSAT